MGARAAALRAIGYVRVSTKLQKDGYSPEIQEKGIRDYCAKEGWQLVGLEQDVEKGHVLTRPGYQRVLDAARARAVDRIVLYMFDRLGRDAGELMTRGAELERIGVGLVSVKEGPVGGYVDRWIRGGMAELYSRQLAGRIRPAREQAARNGTHCGRTPYGYLRRYPELPAASGRAPLPELIPDPERAPTVRRLYEHYAGAAPMTLRQLALWANREPGIARPMRTAAWGQEALHYMLRNPVYRGAIAYNRYPNGYYERAGDDEAFVAEARHEPLVAPELWDAVQERLGAPGPKVRRSRDGSVPLAAGLLLCSHCGGKMVRLHSKAARGRQSGYTCQNHMRGKTECPGPNIVAGVVHAALLDQVKRLRWHPWKRTAVAESVPVDVVVKGMITLRQERDSARDFLEQHRQQAAVLDLSDPDIAFGYSKIGAAMYDHLQAVEREMAEAGVTGEVDLDALEALHRRLRKLAADVQRAEAAGDEAALRALVAPLVKNVRIITRVPERRTTWARAYVVWTDDMVMLLRAGVIGLADDVPAPAGSVEFVPDPIWWQKL